MNASVDVVIPVYNGERTIRQTVESVLRQLCPNDRVIVVDDGSTDSTLDRLGYFNDPRIHLLTRQHAGVSAARNAGIAAGTGKFVVFLDADDQCEPRWLEVLRGLAPDAALVACGGRIDQQGHRPLVKLPKLGDDGRIWPEFLAGLFMVRRDVLEQVGGYDPALARSENTDLGLRLMRWLADRDEKIRVTDEVLLTIRRPTYQSAKYSAEVRRAAAERMLEKNPQWRTTEPQLAGTYHAIAGYAAHRMRDTGAARTHLKQAVRYHPRRLKYWLLLARSFRPV